MTAELFDYFRSTASWRVRIACNLKAVRPQRRFVALRRGEQRSDTFRAVNPAGLVPFWREGDFRLAQSLAVIERLDETIPEPPLFPRQPERRALVREIALTIACDIHPLGNLRVLDRLTASFGADDEARAAWAAHWIEDGFHGIETRLRQAAGRFCVGDQVTLADICLVPQVFNARRFGIDLTPFPIILRVEAEAAALPAFAAAEPARQPDAG